MGRNAHKNTWPVAQLPFQADPQNRRFPECGKPFFVLADTSDSSGYKNDVRGVYLKRALNTDTIDFYVEFNGVQLTPLGSPVYFPNDPLVAGFVVDWRQHLAITGPGCYRIKVEANLAGLAVDYYEGSYNVQPWSIDRAMGTVRLYSKFDSYNREKDVNFKESGFIDSIRFNGFFGKMQPNTEVNNLIGVNRELRKVTRRNDKTYELQSDPLNICHTKRIIDDHLIDENLILVCDHNSHNHSYEYRDLGCIVDEVGEVNYNEGRGAVVNATFKDKYALNKSMFINGMMNGITPAPPIPTCDPATWTLEDSAGNTLDSGSIVSGGSETITAPDTDLEINGTPEGSFTAGSTIDLQLTDGVNPVTPVSVGRVGDTVTVEVASAPTPDPAGDFLTATGITDATIESAIRDLVYDLQTFGIWDKLHAIYPFVGGTATNHKFNLKDPRDKDIAFRISFFGGITHDANGVTGNGTNGFFKPCYTHESPDYLLNNFACIYSRTNSQSGTDLGQFVSMPFQFNPRDTTDLFVARNSSGTLVSVSNTDSRGFFAMSRDNSVNFRMYNNSVESIITNTGITLSSSGFGSQYTGLALQISNGSRTNYSNRNLAFMAFGESLNTSEVANMKTAIDTFQTTLSRNV